MGDPQNHFHDRWLDTILLPPSGRRKSLRKDVVAKEFNAARLALRKNFRAHERSQRFGLSGMSDICFGMR